MKSIEIYLVKVDSPMEAEAFHYLLRFVQAEKRSRILKQNNKQKAENMLVGEILAKTGIQNVFGIAFKKQNFVYPSSGKPYLANHPDVHFSISHSGEYVACGISDKPIGVDVQKISAFHSFAAKRVCSEEEYSMIANCTDKDSAFTKLWTQKEAVLKKLGTGIFGSDIKNCLVKEKVQSERMGEYWLSVSEGYF